MICDKCKNILTDKCSKCYQAIPGGYVNREFEPKPEQQVSTHLPEEQVVKGTVFDCVDGRW